MTVRVYSLMRRSSGGRPAAASANAGQAIGSGLDSGGPRLRTLGRLELEPAATSRPKPLLLLAYLALEGGGTRDQLSELFFANSADPRDSLSTTLRRLGRIAGAVEINGQLVTTRIACDASDVLRLLDNGALADACNAYDGTFLAGVTQPLPADGEEWIFGVREYFSRRVLDANLLLGEVALQNGDLTTGRNHAAAAYALHEQDLFEPAVIDRLFHLMRRTNHPQAGSVMDLVKDVFGARLTDTPPDSAVSSLGPSRPGPLISREAELEAVVGSIVTSEARLITIHGPGGIGKTRLAQELIRSPAVAIAFGAARAFVPLEAVLTPAMIPAAIAGQCGFELPAAGDQWAALASEIAGREQLLVLDGWEHLREANDVLLRLLQQCPGLKLVVTSRETLRVPVESVLSLVQLGVPSGSDPATIRSTPAFRMFFQRARRHDLTLEFPDAAVVIAARICRAVDGLPLALELAGAWTRSMSLVEIAETLEKDPVSLVADNAAVGARHGSLRRVLDSAWLRLKPRERQVLARLSVFRGGFRRDAAAAVAGASLADLMVLLDQSWLATGSDGRFEQHLVLRHYAKGRLDEMPEVSREVHEAHNRHYLDSLTNAAQGDPASTSKDLLKRLLEEEGNMLASLERSVERRDASALTVLAQALQWYFAVRGRFRDADTLFERAIAELPEDDPSLYEALSLLLSGRAWCRRFVGDVEDALVLAQRSLDLAEESRSIVARYAAFDALGQAQMLVGDNQSANNSFRAALELAHELADDGRACRVMEKLVYTNMAVGELEEATAISEAAMKLVVSGVVKPSLDAVVTYLAAGFLALAKRDWRRAVSMMGTGLDLTNQIDHPGPAALLEAVLSIGEVASGLDDGNTALVKRGAELAAKSLETARSRGEVLPLTFAAGAIARVAAHEGRFAAAHEILGEAIALAWSQGNRTAALWALPWQVELYHLEGKEAAAKELARALALDPGTPVWIPQWLEELGVFRRDADTVGASLDELVASLLRT